MKVLQGSLGLLVGHYSWIGVWRVGRVWGKNQRRSVGNATMMPIWAPRRAHVRLSPHHAWLLQPRLPYSRGRRTQLTQPRLSPVRYQPSTGTQIKLTGNKPSLAGRLPPRLQQPTPLRLLDALRLHDPAAVRSVRTRTSQKLLHRRTRRLRHPPTTPIVLTQAPNPTGDAGPCHAR